MVTGGNRVKNEALTISAGFIHVAVREGRGEPLNGQRVKSVPQDGSEGALG